MDRYTKVILTVIAIALSLIAINPYVLPKEAHAFMGTLTYGDLLDAQKNGKGLEFIRNIPVVWNAGR